MNALVTGGGGFLGSVIVKKLVEKGVNVTILNRHKYLELEKLGVRSVECDLADNVKVSDACAGMDMVFHVGAKEGFWGKYEDYYDVNVRGTTNVIDGCLKHGVKKLIYTSTASVVFADTDLMNVDESTPYAKNHLFYYSETKAEAERRVLRNNGTNGLLTVSLRPHLIWGPGDKQIMARIIKYVKKGKLKIVGNGLNRVDITYIDNAADAHLLAADALSKDSKLAGSAYFISQGEPVLLWEFINKILLGVGIEPIDKKVSFGFAYRLGFCLEKIYGALFPSSEPPLTRFIASQFSKHHYFNISRAKKDFGYKASVSTEEGFKKLIEYLKTL
ncbi:MAG TPA: NAD-dependent epimerase/dehydratase family protein [Candidatus Wallbacteria bacterium]|nr:NAD-dependent epimerase/dehydratase family protein [Candidatus Wallbacteria bacterium]